MLSAHYFNNQISNSILFSPYSTLPPIHMHNKACTKNNIKYKCAYNLAHICNQLLGQTNSMVLHTQTHTRGSAYTENLIDKHYKICFRLNICLQQTFQRIACPLLCWRVCVCISLHKCVELLVVYMYTEWERERESLK